MSQPLNILIVCQSGVGIGLGHLKRSLAVVRSLHNSFEVDIKLMLHGDSIALSEIEGASVVHVERNINLRQAITSSAVDWGIQLVIFDLQPQLVPVDIKYLLMDLRALGCKLVSIDSMSEYEHLLDLIFVPSFRLQVQPSQLSVQKYIYGWDCFLLDTEKRQFPWVPGRKILALTGGSDATKLGESWPIELNSKLNLNCQLDWVTGPYSSLPIWPNQNRIQMRNHIAPPDLASLMAGANYAITIYGVSFFELLHYGVPTVVFSPYLKKDEAEIREIEKLGIALVAEDEHDAIDKMNFLMRDNDMARALSEKSLQIMSSSGGGRFSACIVDIMTPSISCRINIRSGSSL